MVRLGAVQRGMARRDWASNGEAHMVRFQSDAIRLGAVQVVTARVGAVQVRLCDYVLNHAKAHAGAARLNAVRIEQV